MRRATVVPWGRARELGPEGYLEARMTQFFKDQPMAWANVLTIKGTQNTGIAKKKARRSSGAPAGAPPQPLDEDCPMD